MKTWAERVEEWRREDSARAAAHVVILSGNPQFLGAVVAVWPMACPTWAPPTSEPPEDGRLAWDVAWAREEDVVDSVVDATGLPRGEARSCVRIVKINRIAYPDGTLSIGAKTWMAAQMGIIVKSARRGSAQEKPEKPAPPPPPAAPDRKVE